MISDALRTYWSEKAGWLTDVQVEQDLWLHLLLISIYSQSQLADELIFWGGTALHMFYLTDEDGRRMRYSEDLDFLRRTAGGIGPVLTPLGEMIKGGGMGYTYDTRTTYPKGWARIPTNTRDEPLKVKFEFNTWERNLALGTASHRFDVSIPEELLVPGWPGGAVSIPTPTLDEQAAFKFRALWERDKGRDLFDLWAALTQGGATSETVSSLFDEHYRKDGFDVARFMENLMIRLDRGSFERDLRPFVRSWPPYGYDPSAAVALVREQIVGRLG